MKYELVLVKARVTVATLAASERTKVKLSAVVDQALKQEVELMENDVVSVDRKVSRSGQMARSEVRGTQTSRSGCRGSESCVLGSFTLTTSTSTGKTPTPSCSGTATGFVTPCG